MNKILFFAVLLVSLHAPAQTYLTRNGFIGFYSKTPLEDIIAENNQVYAVVDAAKNNIGFSLLVKGFLFPKQLMQQHFNENYAESDQYPKSSFIGNYIGDVDLSKNGTYPVRVKGQLTFHGVTQTIDVPATLEVQDDVLIGKSEFKLKPSDHNIRIPNIVREKIAQWIDVRVSVKCNKSK